MERSLNFLFFYALLLAPGEQRVKENWPFLFFLLFFRVCVANEQLGPFSCGNQGQSIQWVLFL